MASQKPKKTSSKVLQVVTEEMQIEKAYSHSLGKGVVAIPEARHQFKVGDSVELGFLTDPKVVDIRNDGKIIIVKATRTDRDGSSTVFLARPWMEIRDPNKVTPLRLFKENELRINYMQNDVSGLVHKVLYFGTEVNPPYQRPLVWSEEDKVKLIDTIVNNGDIGKFLFLRLGYKDAGPLYEVVDGKQRLDAILSFISDQFPYQGVYFSQFCHNDRHRLLGYPVAVAELEKANLSNAQVLDLFLRVNTTGRQIDPVHLEQVRHMRDALEHGDKPNTLGL